MRPQYVEGFHCIAGDCEDSCCVGWKVDVDRDTYHKYQSVAPGPLRDLIDANVLRTQTRSDGFPPVPFAAMRMPPSKICPMLNTENLCQLQCEMGPSYLSRLCSSFPRVTHKIDDLSETTLVLSCPEAARIVLSDINLMGSNRTAPVFMTWDDSPKTAVEPLSYFWPIREFIIKLLRNRNYSLWERLFLLGAFSRRLDVIFGPGGDKNYPALDRGFSHAVSIGNLRSSIETIPADHALQLGLVLLFAKSRVDGGNVPPRLVECWDRFADGIGLIADGTFEDQCAAYDTAYERFYAPFFLEHPQILENLLLNMIFRSMFPFGIPFFNSGAAFQPARQYAFLVIEFALIKGMLIGAAGSRKGAFSIEDVVRNVQVIAKNFEHDPHFLTRSFEFLKSKGLDNAHGLTMLVRN